MSAKSDIRNVVARQVADIHRQAGPLSLEELERLESLARIAILADKIEAGDIEDPAEDSAALERALTGGK